MNLNQRLLGIALLAVLMVSGATPALAGPPTLPSSFYGLVKIDGLNVPAGTLITASINGTVVAQTATFLSQGHSVYTLNVPADDPDTTNRDGGVTGDTITITVLSGSQSIVRPATWQSGSNTQVDLARYKVCLPLAQRKP